MAIDMNLIGIDLAWQSARNTSAAAVGTLEGNVLSIHGLREDLDSLGAVVDFAASYPDVSGVAIDAPLVINNLNGQRPCEKELSRIYGARKASCHASNLTLYPDAPSAGLSNELTRQGYTHLADPRQSRWQVECYPHPAIIEVFGLAERLPYKKGNADAKRAGQVTLAGLIRRLADSPVLRMSIDPRFNCYLDGFVIGSKRGGALKRNEDVLDAIVCTYIAGLYQCGVMSSVFGSVEQGYIYVPQTFCL